MFHLSPDVVSRGTHICSGSVDDLAEKLKHALSDESPPAALQSVIVEKLSSEYNIRQSPVGSRSTVRLSGTTWSWPS
jgi:hypothetical protein